MFEIKIYAHVNSLDGETHETIPLTINIDESKKFCVGDLVRFAEAEVIRRKKRFDYIVQIIIKKLDEQSKSEKTLEIFFPEPENKKSDPEISPIGKLKKT